MGANYNIILDCHKFAFDRVVLGGCHLILGCFRNTKTNIVVHQDQADVLCQAFVRCFTARRRLDHDMIEYVGAGH